MNINELNHYTAYAEAAQLNRIILSYIESQKNNPVTSSIIDFDEIYAAARELECVANEIKRQIEAS